MDTKLPLFIGQTLSHSLGRPTEVFGQWLEVHRANLQGHGWKIARLERHLPNRSMLGMERYVVSGEHGCGFVSHFFWSEMTFFVTPVLRSALEIQPKEGSVGFPAHQSATPSNKTSRRGPPPETRHQPGKNKWIINWNEDFFLVFQLHN